VHWDRYRFETEDPLHHIATRPDALVLCYPVISTGEFGHQGSLQNLLGSAAADPARRQEMSLELQVTEHTPTAFLWHTFADGGVPVENSILFAMALRRNKVPFELHVYPNGAHGLGLAPADAHVATWMPLCCEWLAGMGWKG
jgi:acetyl esterase/lipase